MLDKLFKENDLCEKVWKEKYLMPDEELPSDRVKKITKEVNIPELEEVINAGRFIPAGRILYGLGRNTNVTYMNCYVTEILEDSVHGIFSTAEKIAEIYKTGGGVGLALTPLRPTNSYVNNAAEKTSGSVSFASIYNEVTKVIGMKNRRGALILLEDCQHPDIFDFVAMKDDDSKSQITSANISIIIRDNFMLAVQEDKDWDLWYPYEEKPMLVDKSIYFKVKTINECYDYPDKKYFYVKSDNTYRKKTITKTVKARKLWDEIIKRAHSSAEPGLFFIDTVKYDHTVEEFTPIVGSNPCITDDQLILTSEGYKLVKDLINKPFTAVIHNKQYDATGFFSTGNKEVFKVTCTNGMEFICTENHKLVTNKGKIPLKDITNEILQLHEPDCPKINQLSKDFMLGYLVGHVIGDGYIAKNNVPVFCVWNDKGEIDKINYYIEQLIGVKKEWAYYEKDNKSRLYMSDLRKIFTEKFSLFQKDKDLNKKILVMSKDLQAGIISGLFDTDGSVQGTQQKGYSVRLAQSNLPLLQIVQLALQNLGVQSKVLKRKEAGYKLMPDGHGGLKDYWCKTNYELIITSVNIRKFSSVCLFNNQDKQQKLKQIITNTKFYNIKNKIKIKKIESLGNKEVFNCTVSDIHTFICQGVEISNCGEVPLPNNGACNLGAINLSQYIKRKFTSEAYFDEDLFIEDVRKAIRFLDKIVDLNIGRNALEAQDKLLAEYRRLGLGVMGFADMLAYMQIPYDSPSAFRLTEDIFDLLETVAWQESFELAKELGAFPAFDPIMIEHGHLATIIEKGILDYDEVCKYGIRNASLLSIAPTGSIALLAQCSSGIEPIFALNYTRNSDSLSQSSFKVYHQAYKEYLDTGKSDKSDFFKTAYEINPVTRVKLQGLIQKYIDSSISVTVNLPKNATIKDIEQVYETAWESGCKGITVYREGSRSQILIEGEEESILADLRERYDILEGKTIVIPYKQKIYLTANYNPVNNKIVEVFISSAKSGSDIRATYEALGRLISLYLQEGGDVEKIIKTLIDIRGEDSVFTKNGIYHSVPDVIAKSLNKLVNTSISIKCPECGAEISMENGCMSCKNCGYSKCG